MKSKNTFVALAGIATVVSLAGCARPTELERNFGSSVRNMIEAQTFDPSTLSSPSTETIDSGEAQRLGAVLEVYRTDVAKPEAAREEVVISVDGGR